jgi:hypothetical protein
LDGILPLPVLVPNVKRPLGADNRTSAASRDGASCQLGVARAAPGDERLHDEVPAASRYNPGMKYSLRSLMPWIIGPTVWGSSLSLMVYGLWTGAWYGYVFLGILAVFGVVLTATVYYVKKLTTPTDDEILALIRKAQKETGGTGFKNDP